MTKAGALRAEIEAIVHRETRAWDTQDVDLLMTVWHPDMVWPWPPTAQHHDPMDWVMEWGHYDEARWRTGWQHLFDTHRLVHNRREIRRIELTSEGDGAFAVVDIDTLWRPETGPDNHWYGRVCKVYTRVADEWKCIMHTGVLDYGDTRATEAAAVSVREYRPDDAAWLENHAAAIGGTRVVSRGVLHDLTALPGCIAERNGERCGFAFYRVDSTECELVAIAATAQWRGIGSRLLAAVESAAAAADCRRLWLITTNDNADAIRFYQRRGYRLAAVHRDAIDAARRIKPSIPEVGNYGIPIRDELEFEKALL